MLQGAIFDLDGTLLDSMRVWDTLAADYLRSLGLDAPDDLNEIVRTMSLEQSARYFREMCGLRLAEAEIAAGIRAMIRDFYARDVREKSGVRRFLETLSDLGVRMCVATTADGQCARAALERLGLMGYFTAVITSASVGSGKDEPCLYRAALAHLGTPKQKTVVFEDALYALETASRDGFPTVAVYDASEPQPGLARQCADRYIESFDPAEGILDFLKEL